MKRFLLILLCSLMLVGCTDCQQRITIKNNTLTVIWDPPANMTDETGKVSPVPTGAVITFEVVTTAYPTHGTLAPVATVTNLEQVITLTTEGVDTDVGVRCRVTYNGKNYQWSDYLWASIGGVDSAGNPAPWYLRFVRNPDQVQKLRVKS